MVVSEGLPFIRDYVQGLNEAIKQHAPDHELSRLQRYWLSFVILGLLVTNTLCWSRISRFSLGNYYPAAMSWMFRRGKIAWEVLLYASVAKILASYGLNKGILAIDDSDVERSRQTKKLAYVHTLRDKKRSGFFKGQEILFLILVTHKLTIPVGFSFYQPDPALSAWRKEDKRLRKKGVSKKYRPAKPERDANYPTKREIALTLMTQFTSRFPHFRVRAVVADALYDTKEFMSTAATITGQSQVISQIKCTQKIYVNGRSIQVKEFFKNYQGREVTIKLRHQEKRLRYCCAKFKVASHDRKYFILALKYEDEMDYRYIIASDMTWLESDILKAYATRWLVEVFIQDWKSYEGWEKLAMQQGVIGSERGLTISLLSDHALHFHQEQLALYKKHQPAATVGSLREKIMMESLMTFIETILSSENPKATFERYSTDISELFQLRSSSKHMRGVNIEQIGETMR